MWGCEKIDRLEHKRSQGRPKKSWSEVIKYDLKTLGLVEDMTQDRRPSRAMIMVADCG